MGTAQRANDGGSGAVSRNSTSEASDPGSGSVVGLPGRPDGRAVRDDYPHSDGVLVIGREIQVKGEIGSCEILVVEGRLEAAVAVGSLELADQGFFNGKAEVHEADIAGRFEGELTVRGQLLLRPSAQVSGVIRYGRIVIEGGGELSGDVEVLPKEDRLFALESS